MPDQDNKKHKSINELLAAYADQVLDSESPTDIPLSEDPEIMALQKTILHLGKDSPPTDDQESANRIKENVLHAWEEQYRPKQSWLAKIKQTLAPPPKKSYQSTARRRQITVVRIASAVVLMIIVAFILMPSSDLTGGSTSGAAVGELSPWVLLGGGLLVGAIGLWWWLNSRRK